MSRRFFELVVRARRLVTRSPRQRARAPDARTARRTARRDVGGELTQFSFRLALMIDLAYVGIGALGGAAIGRASAPATPADSAAAERCRPDSSATPADTAASAPNAMDAAPSAAHRPASGAASVAIPASR